MTWDTPPHLENFNTKLGTLVANLLALEFKLRETLHFVKYGSAKIYADKISLGSLKIGDSWDVESLSDYSSLKKLINDHNDIVKKYSLGGCVIDSNIVDLRDAIAHGRLFLTSWRDVPRLVKFSRPKGNKVEVVFSEELTDGWIEKQIEWVFDASSRSVKTRVEYDKRGPERDKDAQSETKGHD